MTTYADVQPGDTIHFDTLDVDVVVTSVEKTGSVKFGQVGRDAVPMVRVRVTGMPKPFGGWFETALDSTSTIVTKEA